jgi:hypothetical protein
MPAASLPAPGDVVFVGPGASEQFAQCGFYYRVIGVHDWPAWHGWAWLDGHQLTATGEVENRRSVLVRLAGLLPPNAVNDR